MEADADESETTDGISIEDIDGSFVPRPIPDISSIELDGEVVLGVRNGEGLRTFCLNRTGGLVWSCFDAEATLDELSDDFSEAFSVPREVMAEDILTLTHQVAVIGLLDGVKLPVLTVDYTPPTGLEIGSELPPAELTDLDGEPVSLDLFRGRQMLLVNWSPFCGFCDRIGSDFAEMRPDLQSRGVELVLLSLGEAEPNRELLARHGLECTVLLQQGNVEAFYGVGTPSAYLIDDAGRVASPLVVGADQVPVLAKDIASRA